MSQKQFWILVIESKSTKFDVMTALPQALAYMLDDPKRSTYLWVTSEWQRVCFRQTNQEGTPQYKAFQSLRPEHDLYDVLHLLKYIGSLIKR